MKTSPAGPMSSNLLLEVAGINTHLAKYSYDYRKRLIERNLHSGLYGSTWAWLQSVDYTYNDQNWLTAINTKNATGTSQALSATCTPALPNPGGTPLVTYPEDNDLFYLELRYDQLFTTSSGTGGTISGLGGTPQKAGNIAQMAWRTRGRERQVYSLSYDHLSRLTAANYFDVNTSNVATQSNRFNEFLSYDIRGNILSLSRRGYYQEGANCTFGLIDILSYSYSTNTNRLTSVSDETSSAAAKARGFNPGAGGAGYTYDGNGNQKSDSYKGITNITYNHLNLPKLITFNSGNTIEIIYDAAGNKLRKVVKQGATTLYEQDYNGGLEYRKTPASGTFRIEALYHEEGRYFNLNVDASNTPSWQKEYAIRDHLGSTRITFADKNANGIVEVPGEILQENHYYPFGLGFEGPAWMNDAARDNRYQYNGKEWNDDFGLNWNDYGARWYDGAAGRWNSVDPRAEKYPGWSPYNYVLGNPIRNIDPQGDTVRVAIGNEFINYTPGMEYTGDNKFAQGVINSLNTMNTSEAGTEVLSSLMASENIFSFVNVVPTDKNGNPVEGVRFRPGENGGGTIEAGASTDVGTIAHEMFHGYQIGLGMNAATTAGEVGAYLFQDVVNYQAGVMFGSSVSTNKYGSKYDDAHKNLLFNGFNDADYVSANIFFKFSSKNATGLYNKTKRQFSLFPKPPIAKFLPAFK